MEELESQIAKIQLGGPRHANSFVHITAEKAMGSDCELYVVAELPMFNPAAKDSCENICQSISGALKRAYKRKTGAEQFENAIGLINDELGKLASLGQAHWVDKLNCIIGVKENSSLALATCGKVAAYLFRNGEFTDISCSSGERHPLKIFENFAAGRIRLNDLIILSTVQLFNHLSMDRLKNILADNDFLTATQTIIEILKENAGPEVAFGTLLNLQMPPGQAPEEEIDLENYIVERPGRGQGALSKTADFFRDLLTAGKAKRVPKVDIPKVSFAGRLKQFGSGSISGLNKLRLALGPAARKAWTAGKRNLNYSNFKTFSRQKKIFLISAAVLLLAFVVNVGVAVHIKRSKQNQQEISLRLQEAQSLLANAETAFLYKDSAATTDYLENVRLKLALPAGLSRDNEELLRQANARLAELEQKIEKAADIKVENLGGIGEAEKVTRLTSHIAAEVGGQVISFNPQTGKLEDGVLKNSGEIFTAVNTNNNTAVIFNDSGLQVWNYKDGKAGQAFRQNVPSREDFAGLAYYPTNNRVYVIDKKNSQIVNFVAGPESLSRPVVALRDAALSSAVDLAIDGSIYVLTSADVAKYQGGRQADFKLPYLVKPYSGSGKIYTETDYKNIYLLDSGNNRILILDKRGNLVATLKHSDFTRLKDFAVDEKNKTIYVLNDTSLLKVTY